MVILKLKGKKILYELVKNDKQALESFVYHILLVQKIPLSM